MDQSNGGGAQVQSIRVSFNPVTPQDTTLSGMTRWMLQELGVGVGVNMLA